MNEKESQDDRIRREAENELSMVKDMERHALEIKNFFNPESGHQKAELLATNLKVKKALALVLSEGKQVNNYERDFAQ